MEVRNKEKQATQNRATTFLKREWLGLVSLLIGILGLYFSLKSRSEREPAFMVDPLRTEIINHERVTDTPIRVIKRDGTEIKSDVTLLKFYFWNKGRQAIKSTEILEPLSIQLADNSSEILEFRLLKISRKVTEFQLRPDTTNRANVLLMDFRILEQNDGITGQILYSGNPKSELFLNGIVEGGRIKTNFRTTLERKILFIGPVALTILWSLWYLFLLSGQPRTKSRVITTIFVCIMVISFSMYIALPDPIPPQIQPKSHQ